MLDNNWPLILLALRMAVVAALYLFLLAAVGTLRAELRARSTAIAAPVGIVEVPALAAPPREVPTDVSALGAPRNAAPRLEVVGYAGDEAPPREGLVGRSYALRGPALIGRSGSNSIVLPERHVSSHHARLFRDDGAWWVEDLGSTNGTYVGTRRVEGRARLDNATELRFGPVVARLVDGAS